MSYAELAVATNFSFLRGASHAEELVERAGELGLAAIGIADRNTLAGVVRAHTMAKEKNLRLLVGARLVATDGFETICYPMDRLAYGRLCRLLTRGNRRARKGECHLALADILAESEGQIFIVMPPDDLSSAFRANLSSLAAQASAGPISAPPGFMARGANTAWPRWPNWRTRPASRSWRSTTCITMFPSGRSWPTCSLACARRPLSPKREGCWRRMPSAI